MITRVYYVIYTVRGKFRGKNKKHNSILLNAVVVIGLRDWESQQKNCDLIGVVSAGSMYILSL